jgi:hypothetical protein
MEDRSKQEEPKSPEEKDTYTQRILEILKKDPNIIPITIERDNICSNTWISFDLKSFTYLLELSNLYRVRKEFEKDEDFFCLWTFLQSDFCNKSIFTGDVNYYDPLEINVSIRFPKIFIYLFEQLLLDTLELNNENHKSNAEQYMEVLKKYSIKKQKYEIEHVYETVNQQIEKLFKDYDTYNDEKKLDNQLIRQRWEQLQNKLITLGVKAHKLLIKNDSPIIEIVFEINYYKKLHILAEKNNFDLTNFMNEIDCISDLFFISQDQEGSRKKFDVDKDVLIFYNMRINKKYFGLFEYLLRKL